MSRRAPDLSVYLVADAAVAASAGHALADVVRAAVAGGATTVQVREKTATSRDLLADLEEVASVVPGWVTLLLNDRVDVYLAARARGVRVDGVHLGQSDLPADAVRDLVGPWAVVGVSAARREELLAAQSLTGSDGQPAVDYVGIGALHATATKKDAPGVLGHRGLAALVAATSLPAVAIGGVTDQDVPAVRAAGAAGVAVASMVCAAADPRQAAARLRRAWDRGRAGGPSRPVDVPPSRPRVLAVAGTDPTGGAGLQADLKAVAAMGGYGMGVVTTLVAQNTQGVQALHAPPLRFLDAQLRSVSDDVTVDAVKTGMLGSAGAVSTVGRWLAGLREREPAVPVVVDPVMRATSGYRLLDRDAVDAVRSLLPLATVTTPNVPELAVLAGASEARGWDEVVDQAVEVSARSHVKVVAKGGHLPGGTVRDALVDASAPTGSQVLEVTHSRVVTTSTHGTGCALSAALATLLAVAPEEPYKALVQVTQWLVRAVRAGSALQVGGGHGPVDHLAGGWPGRPGQPWPQAPR